MKFAAIRLPIEVHRVSQERLIFQTPADPRDRLRDCGDAAANPAPSTALLTDWIDRHRRLWFALIALVLALSFNGQWHLGPDSAGYRQLGHNLATSGRYFFRADIPGVDEYHNEQGTRYPGLPILLAVLERIFGPSPLLPLVLMMAMAVLTLVLIYHLMLYRLPRWLAVCVVVGVGINPRFVQYANEILSDVPFLLGVIVTLFGYEQVMRARTRRQLAIGVFDTFIGLLLAAAMRPTFMILGAALVAACLFGIAFGRIGLSSIRPSLPPVEDPGATVTSSASAIRWKSLLLIAALIAATVVFITLIDIRHRQGGFLSGGYEERMVSKLDNFGYKIAPLLPYNIAELLEDALPMAVMGFRSGWGLIPMAGHHLGFGTGFSLIVILWGIGLARRNMLWGLFVLAAILSLILAGPVPRYFLMILPLLLAGWGLFMQSLARRFRSMVVSRFIMGLGLFFLLTINVIASSTFVLTQRGFSKLMDSRHHWIGLHHVGFLRAYDFGRWVGFDRLAVAIHRSTTPHDKLIGPDANVLTYLSDRQIYEPILGNRTKVAGRLFHLALFPADPDWHRSDGDYPLMLKQFLRPLRKQEGRIIAGPQAGFALAQLAPVPAQRLTQAQRLAHARQMAAHRRWARKPATQPSKQ
jgi:hypothetical protein